MNLPKKFICLRDIDTISSEEDREVMKPSWQAWVALRGEIYILHIPSKYTSLTEKTSFESLRLTMVEYASENWDTKAIRRLFIFPSAQIYISKLIEKEYILPL